jgi:MbtH protein
MAGAEVPAIGRSDADEGRKMTQDNDGGPRYQVVVNEEEQYSIWPEEKQPPAGWRAGGAAGTKSECLDYIESVWTDMRPRSLRVWMESQDSKKSDAVRD